MRASAVAVALVASCTREEPSDPMPNSPCSEACIKKAVGTCPQRLVEMCAFNGSGP